MALSTGTVTLDLEDLLGNDYDPRRTKVWATTNVPDDTIVDTDGNKIRLGSGTVTLSDAGTASLTLWLPGVDANPESWQTSIHVSYVDGGLRTRKTRTFGPFTITASADLADLIEEQEVPPTYISTVTALLDGKVDEAEGYADDAAASATAAASSATAAETSKNQAAAIALGDAEEAFDGFLAARDLPADGSDLSASYVPVFRGLFDGSDETTAFQSAVNDVAGKALIIPRGATLKTQRITVPVQGLTVILEPGAILDYIDPGINDVTCLFRAEDCAFFELEGGHVEASNATGRTSQHGLIRAKNLDWLRVQHASFGKSSATAVHTWDVAEFVLDDLTIEGTFADGLHLSRGTRNGTVSRIRGRNTGDDLVAVNSYSPSGGDTFGQCKNVTVRDVKGYDIGANGVSGYGARNVAINGGLDCIVEDIYADGCAVNVLVSRDTGMYDPANVHVSNVVSHNTGVNPPPGGATGAVYVAHCAGGSIDGVTGTATEVKIASTSTNIDLDRRGSRRFIPAPRFALASGTPAMSSQATTRMPGWLFDAAADESISLVLDCRNELRGWLQASIDFVWTNGGAGAGDVIWRTYTDTWSIGDAVEAPVVNASSTGAAPAAGVLATTPVATGVIVGGDYLTLRAYRVASAGGDTLANDAMLVGVVLRRTL